MLDPTPDSWPAADVGTTVVVEERWQELLWSAVPHRVVAMDDQYAVTALPFGTVAARASSRGVPGAEGLAVGERKHRALATLEYRVRAVPCAPATLHVFRRGRWSRVNLGWDQQGRFTGWYVNFERPVTATPTGWATMDLVLDLFIHPDGSWAWKDAADFDRAVEEGLLDEGLRQVFADEAALVFEEHRNQVGAFEPRWLQARPEPGPLPTLAPEFEPGGSAWDGAPVGA